MKTTICHNAKTSRWFPATIGAIVLAATASSALGWGWKRPEIIPFDEAELFFEQNATDGDLGLHLKVDGEGWKHLILMNSRYRTLLKVRLSGNLGNVIGLTELFSESAEPSFDEVSKENFLSLFPAGYYFYFARTVEGDWLFGMTELTQELPGDPVLIGPEEEEEVDPEDDLVIEWEPVADPPGSAIEFYEVVCEKDEDDELLRVFSVIMLPEETTVRVPSEFLEAGKEYKVEIIAQEESGNRTAIEVPFETEGGDAEEEEEDDED